MYMYEDICACVCVCTFDDISQRTFLQWVGASLKLIPNLDEIALLDGKIPVLIAYIPVIKHSNGQSPMYKWLSQALNLQFIGDFPASHFWWHRRGSPQQRKLWRWRTTTSAPPRSLWAMDLLTTPRCPDAPCRDLVRKRGVEQLCSSCSWLPTRQSECIICIIIYIYIYMYLILIYVFIYIYIWV